MRSSGLPSKRIRPSWIHTTRSARMAACGSWVTVRVVRPATSSSIASSTADVEAGSSPVVASSRMMIGESRSSARAMAMR